MWDDGEHNDTVEWTQDDAGVTDAKTTPAASDGVGDGDSSPAAGAGDGDPLPATGAGDAAQISALIIAGVMVSAGGALIAIRRVRGSSNG